MADTRQPTFGVFIGSSGSTNEITRAVESVTIEDHDRLADKAVVRINDSLHLAADALRPGQRIEINMGWQNGEHAVMFAGRIHQPDVHETSGAQGMVITALDYSTVMHQEARSRVHDPGKLSDVISTIVLSYPDLELGDILPDPDPDLPANDPSLTQTNLTDLQFLQALAVRYRARAFVEYCSRHGDPDLENYFFFVAESTIAGQTASTTLRCCGGFHELLEFRMRQQMNYAAPYRPSAVIDPVDGTPATQEPFPDPPDPPAATDPTREAAADAQGAGDAYRAGVTAASTAETQPTAMIQQLPAAGLPSDPRLAEALSQRDPTTIRGLRARALAVGNINLRAKSKVKISGITNYAAGDWYVRVARHKVENGNYTTELILTQ